MFKFSLEKVLGLQQQFEEQAKVALNNLLGQRDKEIQTLNSLYLSLAETRAQLPTSGLLEATALKHFYSYSQLLVQQIAAQAEIVQKCSEAVEQARDEVLRHRREVQKLERIRANKLQDYQVAELRREQKVLDELAVGRFRQNKQF